MNSETSAATSSLNYLFRDWLLLIGYRSIFSQHFIGVPTFTCSVAAMLVARLLTVLRVLSSVGASCILGRGILLDRSAIEGLLPLVEVVQSENRTACFDLCLREARCMGSLLDSGRCRLIRAHKQYEREAPGPPVEVWLRGDIPKRCPPDFTLRRGSSRYKVVTKEKLQWSKARERCLEAGGKLLELLNVDEMNYFKPFCVNHSEFHIGARQLSNAKNLMDGWVWNQSGTSMNASLWHKNQPNDVNGAQNISTLYYSSGDGFFGVNDMSDIPTDSYPYICECISLE